MAQAVLDKSSEKFSPYPAEIDNYFINNTVVLKMYPKGLETVAEAEFPDIQMTSAQQYFTYLTQEIDFWSANDSQNIAQKFPKKTVWSMQKHISIMQLKLPQMQKLI